jgi:hypothetical protein
MVTTSTAPAPPGFIDRLRALIAKLRGRSGRATDGARPAATGPTGGPTAGPPSGETTRA